MRTPCLVPIYASLELLFTVFVELRRAEPRKVLEEPFAFAVLLRGAFVALFQQCRGWLANWCCDDGSSEDYQYGEHRDLHLVIFG